MKKNLSGIICLLLFNTLLFAACKENIQIEGYQIKVKINNLKNDTIYLAYHFGDKQYMRDTIRLDDRGMGVFEGKEPLPGGFYLIVYPSKNYFEVIVTASEQVFSVENDTVAFQKNFKSTGSVENKIFYDDISFISQKQKEKKALDDEYAKAADEAKKAEVKKKMEALDAVVKSQRENLRQSYPASFYAKFLKSLDEIAIPESPKDASGKEIDSLFQYKYYKSHYFENIDFTDDRLLRTPTFHAKVMTYLDKVIPQNPDSISIYCDTILVKSRPNAEMFKYWLITLLNYYAKSNIMCMEAVYVHLVEKYYAKGDASWVAEDDLYRITDRAKKLKPSLCNQVAPNMLLRDTSNNLISMHSVKAKYLMLFFYAPDCGHCKKETPLMLDAYKKIVDTLHIDFRVYAVNTLNLDKGERDSLKHVIYSTDPKDLREWPDFILNFHTGRWINVADLYFHDNFHALYDIQSTPTVLLLDADKKILAKRFSPEQLPLIIEDLEKRSKEKK